MRKVIEKYLSDDEVQFRLYPGRFNRMKLLEQIVSANMTSLHQHHKSLTGLDLPMQLSVLPV